MSTVLDKTAAPAQDAEHRKHRKPRLSDRARQERNLGWKLTAPAFIAMMVVVFITVPLLLSPAVAPRRAPKLQYARRMSLFRALNEPSCAGRTAACCLGALGPLGTREATCRT